MTTILITGANRGIGLALATIYVGRGDRVIATAREPARATVLTALGANVECLPLDVTDEASLARLAERLKGRSIDILIANSGVMGPRGGMDDTDNTAARWASVLATNVMGPFLTVRALRTNVAASRGKVAIISSRMGSSKAAGGAGYLYRASKAAASNIAANLAVELGKEGVVVASFHPGWVRTDMGGPGGDISPAESAGGLVRRIDSLTAADAGAFLNYDGSPIPF
jgi:NAD(P)-dependent dehydrogenase (short-subunit alcohol dehydrogenase family)